MRKLLTLLIALAAIVFAVVSPLSAQGFNGGGFNVGLGPFAIGGYTGPGDIVSGATAWWGIRAYKTAGLGTKVANICNSTGGTDVGCADFNSNATTGIIESKTVSGITCPGANCTVKILYDQSGALSCSSAACDASQPPWPVVLC
jgi:hypothetical protein